MIRHIALATGALIIAASAATAADVDAHKDDHRVVVHRTVVHRTVVRRTVVNNWAPRSDFRSGGRIARADWDRGRVIDYRVYRLRPPPPGYEWREVGGRYVLAAVATGLIASIILSAH